MFRRALLAICLMVTFLAPAVPAAAREEILSFDSDIAIRTDGDLLVAETIRVRAEGRRIKRGIYRDFPVRYVGKSGFVHKVGFTVLEVLKNGEKEPFHTERVGNDVRIYIGNENIVLPSGIYQYTIRYRTSRQLQFYKDHDELYWNVTGNDWAFPIREASATVHLPAGAKVIQSAGYTGRRGSTEAAYRVAEQDDAVIRLEATRPLAVREGLTVAVGFTPGVVDQPTVWGSVVVFAVDNFGLLFLFAGLVVLAAHFWRKWSALGRDPEKGTIIPLYSPPRDLSPAAVSYLHYMGFRNAGGAAMAFIAAIVSLAVRNVVRIDSSTPNKVALERGTEPAENLPAGEQAIWDTLLADHDRFVFERANSRLVVAVQSAFRRALLTEYRGVFFKDNFGTALLGAVLSLLVAVVAVIMQAPIEADLVLMIFATVLGGLGTGLFMIAQKRRAISGYGGGSRVLDYLSLALAVVLVGGGVFLAALSSAFWQVLMTLAVMLLIMMNVAFFFLIAAPTTAGRKLMDETEGFQLYLRTAEADRLNLVGAPEMSEMLFERFLPYAIALGVEEPWSEALSKHIARAMPSNGGRSYSPGWYHGSSGFRAADLSATTSGLVSSIGSSVSNSMPKSSGSSGGGSSGGGGGGGGGGGW